eukprot:Unigene2963_Nuclearia_a/m.9124 Unigene2963_Nuclearia_a/g.9124  ORF Unigene2963_Nuclearia_a/g.9124 Unigene2963_Nuclearia_a/m.9124 type:complete len:309 (+) Unigene2963_Nuclearia_a:167-1093(+)
MNDLDVDRTAVVLHDRLRVTIYAPVSRWQRAHTPPSDDADAAVLAATGTVAVLLVHGEHTHALSWDELAVDLVHRGHLVYTVDLRGHGGSSTGGTSVLRTSLTDYAADVRLAARWIGRPLVVVGHSMGGAIVQKFAELHADDRDLDLRAIALVAAPAPTQGWHRCFQWLHLAPYEWMWVVVLADLVTSFVRTALARLGLLAPAKPDASAPRLLEPVESLVVPLELGFTRFVDPLKITRHRMSVHVYGGRHDRLVPPMVLAASAALYDAPLKLAPHCGHDNLLHGAGAAFLASELDALVRSLQAAKTDL